MKEILLSGKTPFKIDVPYKLINTGSASNKPLIVYLHGYNQNIEQFEELADQILAIEAYHLFIQAPYPIYDRRKTKRVKDWGRAWYLYDGEQEQFVRSLELTSEFVQEIIDMVAQQVSVSRVGVLGYSMGGYLAGYLGLSRWKHIRDLIVIGARIKTEVFENNPGNYEHMNVLALHGATDTSVKSDPQKKCCKQLSEWGANVTYKELDASHVLSSLFINQVKKWLIEFGYKQNE